MESAKIGRKVRFLSDFTVYLYGFFILLIWGCGKDDDVSSIPLSVIEGKVLHHNNEIQSGVVYLKAKSIEFPGSSPSNYDDSVRFDTPPSAFRFENLTPGNYYLYCMGYDYYFQDSVFGGIPVQLKNQETKIVHVAVTE